MTFQLSINQKQMTALTTEIKFILDKRLNEVATIEENSTGKWAFSTSKGYNGWEGTGFNNFDKCYSELKTYEKNSLNDLKYD